MSVWHWIFWLTALYIGYTYAGYPLVLALWHRLRRPAPPITDPGYLPKVSVVITARNEVEAIARKLDDFLGQEYPADLMEIWVASDASTDGTDEVVREYATRDSRIRLVEFREHVGKSEMLNEVMPRIGGEVAVLADARQRIAADAVRNLVRHFVDPKVGIVGAEMTLVDQSGLPSSECMGFYWKYERSLRRLESELGMLAGISGPLYAIRSNTFRPLPPGSYCEDVTVALYVRSEGMQVRWEPAARLYEPVRDLHVEFGRKVRHLVGNYQLLCQFWPLYLPWRGSLALTLISHKLCRLFIPLALLVLLVATAVLASSNPFYAVLLGLQALFYGMGLLGLAHSGLRTARLVSACNAFCVLNWAALLALVHVLRHGPRIQWR